MVKFKVTGLYFRDGNLAERMTSEKLPITLRPYDNVGNVIWFECSPELLKAIAASGLEYELSPESDDPFEGTAKANVPGSHALTSYRKHGAYKTTRRPFRK